MGFDTKWNEVVYKNKLQVNRYPFDRVVSTVFKYFGSVSNRSEINILELGCGTANNICFIAQEGFNATGIEGSDSAVEIGNKILKEKGLVADLICQDFTDLSNIKDQSFDMVIDRGSITHNRRKDIENTILGVHRILKNKGIFLSHIFSTKTSSMKYGTNLGDGSFTSFTEGFYADHPMLFFFASSQDIYDIYESNFTMLSKIHNVDQQMMNKDDYRAMWHLICQKTKK
jgi:ubiquinone/menaquinone biosynthesis C-methylase UbiE